MPVRPFVLVQAALAASVGARLARGKRRRGPLTAAGLSAPRASVSVVIPARDEADRIGPVLRAMVADPDVLEVVVVDDRSTDGTGELARSLGARVVTGEPLPEGWIGKPWALHQGLRATTGEVVMTLDADAEPLAGLVRAVVCDLLAQPEKTLVTCAVRFACDSPPERLLHPAFLTSLVYRHGPGDVDGFQPHPDRALANGQCLAVRREPFEADGGFTLSAPFMTDDIGLARALRRRGWDLRTLDAADLLVVRMYTTGRQTWHGWGRSLMGADVTTPTWKTIDAATIWAVQALPLWRVISRRGTRLDLVLLALRLLLHSALRRSYTKPDVWFWLAPLADVPAAIRLTESVVTPTRHWRGRRYGRHQP